jgi:hypothetical protein
VSDLTAINATAAAAGRKATTWHALDVDTITVTDLAVHLGWTPAVIDGVHVVWGDGIEEDYGVTGADHTYSAAGSYRIRLDPYGTTPATVVDVTVTDPA